ncbi:MAG: NAD(P)(+) transhydrogenase (Re/Si-specific) subunit beta [Pirellulales bacterium]|nr:NAD(P)(+) transhydrogenase (Re/Si-specific) subunit beta [Pirellulales bacterium]
MVTLDVIFALTFPSLRVSANHIIIFGDIMDTRWHLVIDLVIIVIFFVAMGQFRTPRGARRGNITAAFALLCAMIVVLSRNTLQGPAIVILAMATGSVVGWLVAMRVGMIQIPAMVAFQHGAGGIAAFLISYVELTRNQTDLGVVGQISGILGIIIGAVTFSGSMVASAKLAGIVRQTPTLLQKHNNILATLLLSLAAFGFVASNTTGATLLCASLGLIGLSILLGIIFAMRIGGADMPVLISFLNATAGIAASFCGIVIQNRLLIACGATVAASGSILTHVMCAAMNRSLFNVLIAADLKPATAALADTKNIEASLPSFSIEETTESPAQAPLDRAVEAARNAQKVIMIPGYGMALAHAQFEVVEIAILLKKQGKEVQFAIHPIAGRMPGHMHVLLAEAEADPDILFDLPEINPQFQETDLVLIVGACDVVNPAAITTEGTPISGMPILAAHEAKHVLVCNLDARPGYSGVDNPLYLNPKTILMLGDAKTTLNNLLQALG